VHRPQLELLPTPPAFLVPRVATPLRQDKHLASRVQREALPLLLASLRALHARLVARVPLLASQAVRLVYRAHLQLLLRPQRAQVRASGTTCPFRVRRASLFAHPATFALRHHAQYVQLYLKIPLHLHHKVAVRLFRAAQVVTVRVQVALRRQPGSQPANMQGRVTSPLEA